MSLFKFTVLPLCCMSDYAPDLALLHVVLDLS